MPLLSKPGLIPVKIEGQGSQLTTQVNKINFTGSGVTASVGQFNDVTVTINALSTTSASYAFYATSASYTANASYATTASYFSGSITNALTASYVNPLRQVVQITGSLNITGSTFQTGNNTLAGNTILSGSITISGSTTVPATPTIKVYGDMETNGVIKFDPVVKNIDNSISASYIYVSGSTNDLYFTQNGEGYSNTTRLRWLEGNLYTGLLNGGLITSASSTTFNISSGSGIVVNLNASIGENPYPTVTYVNWNSFTNQTLTYRTSSIQTFIGIDASGSIIQQTTPWSDGQYNTSISIGTVLHQNKSTINGQITYPNVAYGYKQRTYDFIKAFGPLKLTGYAIYTSSSLGLTVGSGTAFADGRNYQNDPNNPSYITDAGTNVSKIFRYYQSGSDFVQDTNGGLGYTVIDPANFNPNGTGVLTGVSPSKYTIQRVFYYPNSATKGIVVYYGNTEYGTLVEGVAGIPNETFFEVENTKQNAIYLGAIVIKGNATFLSTPNVDYQIIAGGLFRAGVSGGGGGGASPSVAFPYTGSATISGSLTVVGPITATSFTGSLFGTSSWATSASFAISSSYVLSSSYALSSSFSATSSNALTSSFPWFQTGSNIINSGSGNVGISTTTPTQKLHVGGDIQLSTNLYFQSSSNSIFVDQNTGTYFRFNLNTAEVLRFNRVGTAAGKISIVQFSAGVTAATQPAYSFSGSVNTGLFLFGTGKVGISTEGTSKMVVDQSGSVGIGTNTPLYLLDVNGTGRFSQNVQITGSGTNSLIVKGSGTTSATTTLLIQNANNTASLIVTDNSYIGIGTTTPSTQLDVSGSGRFTSNLIITGSVVATSFTGSLFGTSSWAISASRAITSSYAFSTPTTPSTLFVQGYLTGNQSIPNNTDTIINFERQYDLNSWLDIGTRRFKPTIAGYYSVSIGAWLENPASPTNQVNIQIRKSTGGGPTSTVMILQQPLNNGTGISLAGTRIFYMDGSTDYLDFTIFQGSGAPRNLLYGGTPDGSGTWFSAHLITM